VKSRVLFEEEKGNFLLQKAKKSESLHGSAPNVTENEKSQFQEVKIVVGACHLKGKAIE
jgi:hypothetical protein